MRVLFCAYRDWAFAIFEKIKDLPHEFMLIKSKDELVYEKVKRFSPDIILFYGWSWMVKDEYLKMAPCVCLHPSPLPKFRGGSPIQNQIVRGVKESAVTLFYMNDKVDAGDIILQKKIPFTGHLHEVLHRMTNTGAELTVQMLSGKLDATPQDESKTTSYPRRKPSESELTIEDIKTKTAEELNDFIRCLEDPYPNAFIRTKDGKRLLIKSVEIDEPQAR
jgi:methionyl-tRNA formyltransferase